MTCTEARILTAFRRPGEMLPADADALARHLAGCPECAAAAAEESAFDTAVARAVEAVPVPAGLKASLHAAATKTIRAGRWRKLGRTAALAAVLLAAVGLGVSIYAANRPAVDLNDLAFRSDVTGRESEVKSWLAANGLPTTLPDDFDFALCTSHGFGDVQGRSAPVLLFQDPKNPTGFAKVFILSDTKFDVKATAERAGSSFVTAVKVPGGAQAPGVTFLILHTGELNRFLRPVQPPG
jgi:hypothetical protein